MKQTITQIHTCSNIEVKSNSLVSALGIYKLTQLRYANIAAPAGEANWVLAVRGRADDLVALSYGRLCLEREDEENYQWRRRA